MEVASLFPNYVRLLDIHEWDRSGFLVTWELLVDSFQDLRLWSVSCPFLGTPSRDSALILELCNSDGLHHAIF